MPTHAHFMQTLLGMVCGTKSWTESDLRERESNGCMSLSLYLLALVGDGPQFAGYQFLPCKYFCAMADVRLLLYDLEKALGLHIGNQMRWP